MSEQKKPSWHKKVKDRIVEEMELSRIEHRFGRVEISNEEIREMMEEYEAAQERIVILEDKVKSRCGYIILADSEDFKTPLCPEHFSEYENLKSKAEKLAGALRWYGNKENYQGKSDMSWEGDEPICEDFGEKAREILAEWEKE